MSAATALLAAALLAAGTYAGGTEVKPFSRPEIKEEKEIYAPQLTKEERAAYLAAQPKNPFKPGGEYENMKIVYKKGDEETVLEAKDVTDWVRYWPDGHWDIDDDKIAAYVTSLQETYDTSGKPKLFQTTMDGALWITKGDYGWKINRSKEISELSRLLRNNGTIVHNLHFETKGELSDSPYTDYGDSYVEIDLSRQVLWLYEDGELTLISNIVSGLMNTDRQTPGGIYSVKYKQSPAVLRGVDYASPVTYWMPFNGGIGLHDATWQYSFGGDACYTRGSHGCINLPLDLAELIYEKVSKGFPVVCYYSDPEDDIA